MDKKTKAVLSLVVLITVVAAFYFTVLLPNTDSANCQKCEQLSKSTIMNLKDALSSVANGDLNSKNTLILNLSELGPCLKAIYFNQTTNCEPICPEQSNGCWIIIPAYSCGGKVSMEKECMDIPGEMQIINTNELYDPNSPNGILSLTIEKTSSETIEITRV